MFLKHIGEGRVDEARFLCSELGASVPLPRNETENIDLYDAFFSLGKFQTLKQIALGANNANKEALWLDSDGQMLNYTNWYLDELKNLTGSYLQYVSDLNGKWDDTSAENITSVICEKSCEYPCFLEGMSINNFSTLKSYDSLRGKLSACRKNQ